MTTKSHHDRAIEALLRQSLAEPGRSGPSDAHLSAETLAAWADGGLSRGDLAAADAHVADCEQCQALLAAFARTAPVESPHRAWWQRGWTLGWVVPLAAATAAVAIWVAVPDRQGPAASLPPSQTVGSPTMLEATDSARTAAKDSLTGPSEPPPPAALGGRASARLAGPKTEEKRDQANAAQELTSGVQKYAFADRKDAAAERTRESLGRVAPPVVPEAPASAAAGPAVTAPAVTPPAATASAGAAAPAAPPAPAAAAPARARQAGVSELAREGDAARSARAGGSRDESVAKAESVVTAPEIVSSDPSIRWRIGRGGLIQRSADRGATWEVLPTGVTADLLAGISSSPSVCWVVGRAGTVLRAIDGRRFDRVPFPEIVDLAAVRASDARTAVVTTTDGREFRTADGGATWMRNR